MTTNKLVVSKKSKNSHSKKPIGRTSAEKPMEKLENPVEEPVEKPEKPIDVERTKKVTNESIDMMSTTVESSTTANENTDPEKRIEEYFNEMLTWAKEESKTLREHIKKLHELRRMYNMHIKKLKKTKGKRQINKNVHKEPSGFAASSSWISEPLRTFLKLGENETMARTKVTKQVTAYIKKNQLGDGKTINPDAALEKVIGDPAERMRTMQQRKNYLERLAMEHPDNKSIRKRADNCKVTDELTYFNLPIHLNPQFIKEDKVQTVESSSSTLSATV
jgi:hypothetical protein